MGLFFFCFLLLCFLFCSFFESSFFKVFFVFKHFFGQKRSVLCLF